MDELNAIIDLLKAAIDAGQTVEITASSVTITPGQSGPVVEISSPTITTTA